MHQHALCPLAILADLPPSQEGWGTLPAPAGLTRHLASSIIPISRVSVLVLISPSSGRQPCLPPACLKINQDVSSSSLESLSQNLLRSSFILHLISDQPPPVAHIKDPGPGLLVLFPPDSHRLLPFPNTDILSISESHPLCCPNYLNLPMTTPRLMSPGPVIVLPCKL